METGTTFRKGVTINVDGRKLDYDIKKIEGKNFKGTRISTFILKRDFSYYSKVVRTGVCNVDDFKTLCAYYELKEDDYIIKKEEPTKVTSAETASKTPSQIVNLDALIVGINKMYQIQKDNSGIMLEMLQELENANKKINSLENALGQIVNNIIPIKENTDAVRSDASKMVNTLAETRSAVNIIQGRIKELNGKFKG